MMMVVESVRTVLQAVTVKVLLLLIDNSACLVPMEVSAISTGLCSVWTALEGCIVR